MSFIENDIIKNLLKQIEELNKLQRVSECNEYFFIELIKKLGGFDYMDEIIKSKEYVNIKTDTFADMFLILVDAYIKKQDNNLNK